MSEKIKLKYYINDYQTSSHACVVHSDMSGSVAHTLTNPARCMSLYTSTSNAQVCPLYPMGLPLACCAL